MRNWAGNVVFGAEAVAEPRSVEELQELVAATSHVRALGSGHSFSRVADTVGTLVTTRSLPFAVEVDPVDRVAVVPGGATYARVTAALHAGGLGAAQPRLAAAHQRRGCVRDGYARLG